MSELSDRLLAEIEAQIHPGRRTPAYLAELERAGIPVDTPADASTIVCKGTGEDRHMRALTIGEVTAVILRVLDEDGLLLIEAFHPNRVHNMKLLADEIHPGYTEAVGE